MTPPEGAGTAPLWAPEWFPPRLLAALGLAGLIALPVELGSESLTLQSYYPSPLGIYTNLTTTDAATLARDAGGVTVGGPTHPAALTVSGVTTFGSMSADPAGTNGSFYYNAARNVFRAFANGAWSDMSLNGDLTVTPLTTPATRMYAGTVYQNASGKRRAIVLYNLGAPNPGSSCFFRAMIGPANPPTLVVGGVTEASGGNITIFAPPGWYYEIVLTNFPCNANYYETYYDF